MIALFYILGYLLIGMIGVYILNVWLRNQYVELGQELALLLFWPVAIMIGLVYLLILIPRKLAKRQ